MKKLQKFLLVFLIIFIITPLSSFAQEDDDFAEMSLEDLMNIKVSTVSKKSQSISEAPAIITVITAEQIEELGVQGIPELMTYVPGFTVADSYWKRQIVTARGIKMTLYNDKILMLVNGIPAYGAAAMEHFLDLVPISSIKQIEIIRGPGSTLYGTNAFAAVINIITKDGDNFNQTQASIKLGSFGTRETDVTFGDKKGDFNYHFGALMKNNDGFIKTTIGEKGLEGDIAYENDINSFYTNLGYKDISINAGYYFQRYGKFGPIPAFYAGNRQHIDAGKAIIEKYYMNVIYNKEINEKLNTKITFHFDDVDKQHEVGDFGEIYQLLGIIDTTVAPDYYRFGGKLYQGEAQVGYIINDNISLIGGICGELRVTENLADMSSDWKGDILFAGSTEEMPFNVMDYGAYLQADGSFGKLGYVVGIRGTYLGISENMYFTPRAGLVYNFSKSSSVKLLYGEAFRGAGPQEQYYKVPKIIYGPDIFDRGLEPERIKTYELAWDQTVKERYKFRINGFYTNIFDLIGRRPATTTELADPNFLGGRVYDNLGEQTIYGGELEVNAYPTDQIQIWANFSYKDGYIGEKDSVLNSSGTVITIDEIPFMENITANLGITFKFLDKKLLIAPSFQYVGEREGYMEVKTDPLALYKDTKATLDAYPLLNLNISYNFNEKYKLSMSGLNLFNKEYFYPADVRKSLENLPGGPGIAVYFKLGYTF